MAAYHGRRAPNVSQYLANLNTVQAPHDITNNQNDIGFSDDGLDFLTNAEFFDFDALNVEFPQANGREDGRDVGTRYQFPQTYPASMSASPVSVQNFAGQVPPMIQNFPSQPQSGDKRKATLASMQAAEDLEEQSRMAAEEDKRRRNTAASARFRVKKKQREAALEKQAKEMSEKVQMLEGKVLQLEMENKWLKGLITDKHDGKTLEEMRKEREEDERSQEDRKDGVGTPASNKSEEA